MTTPPFSFAPRLLAGLSAAAFVAGVGLFAASRPAHSTGGPVPVAVTNTVTNQDRDSPARQPVEVSTLIFSPSASSMGSLVYAVPAGKRLVVESMSLVGGGGGGVSYNCFVRNEVSPPNFISFATLSTGLVTTDIATATQPMHLSVEPGGKIMVDIYTRGVAGGFNAFVSLSGYLVDVP